MAEYASLIIGVDATQVVKADAALENLTRSADQAEKKTGVLDKAFGTMKANVLALAGTLSVGMFTKWIIGAGDAADSTSEAAEAAGLATVEYAKLSKAMELGAAEGADIGTAMRGLNAAIAGNNAALQSLGIATTDATGKMRSGYDVTLDVAQAFSRMDDETQKAALAQDLFGRSGAAMLPMLNKGREGIIALGSSAVTASAKLEQAGGQWEENMSGLLGLFNQLRNSIAEEVLPRLNDVLEWAVKFGPSLVPVLSVVGSVAGVIGGVLNLALKSVLTSLSLVMAAFQVLGKFIGSAGAAIALAASGDFKGAYQAIGKGAFDMVADVKAASAQLVALWGNEEAAAEKHGKAMAAANAPAGTTAATGTLDVSSGAVTTGLRPEDELSKYLGEQLLLEEKYAEQRKEKLLEEEQFRSDLLALRKRDEAAYAAEDAARQEAQVQARQRGIQAIGRLLEQGSSKSKTIAKAAEKFNAMMAASQIARDTLVAASGARAALSMIPIVGPALGEAAFWGIMASGTALAAQALTGRLGGGPSVSVPSASSTSPATVSTTPMAGGGQSLTINVVGLGEDTLVTGGTVKKIMDAIGERLADGARMGPVNMVFSQ